jgi:hypothetical protein
MKLQPINDGCLTDASALLKRGFPERTSAFWDEGLARVAAHHKATDAGPIGYLLIVGEKAVGVILTIASRRGPRDVVNLSSWYIDPKHRWLAARMLGNVTSRDKATYTDLTPSPESIRINESLGFTAATTGYRLFVLPLMALRGASRGRIVPFEKLRAGALSSEDRTTLARHRELGCIAAALDVGSRVHPLLFQRVRRRGLPVARLLLAEDRRLVADNIGAIARFLLRRGSPFLLVHADANERMPGGIVWNRTAPIQVRGAWERGRIDYTFSELVFLGV